MSSYVQVLNAIEAYYGRNDIWQAMYNWTGEQATAQELAKAVEQVPGVRAVRSVSGKMQYFEYIGEEYTPHVVSDLAAQSVNSNVSAAITVPAAGGGGIATKVKTPVQMNTAGGAVTGMKSGLAQAGKFTMNEVLPAVAAASVGISLGKWIDSALYNANPDFWDAQGMGSLNPETWDSITSGDDSLNSRVFNMVFGIDGDNTQAYVDEQALAYMAAYMAEKGVFNAGEISSTVPTNKLYHPTNYNQPIKILGDRIEWDSPSVMGQHEVLSATNGANIIVYAVPSFNNSTVLAASGTPFSISRNVYINGVEDPSYSYTNNAVLVTSSKSGDSCYLAGFMTGIPSGVLPAMVDLINVTNGSLGGYTQQDTVTFWVNKTGSPAIDGITEQNNATVFDTSNITDLSNIQSVLEALKQQFPTLWDNAVTNTAIDPDTGEEVTTTYVPTGYPQIDPENPTQPIANISTQADTDYDPSENPDISEQISQLISYITDTSGDTPTMQPDEVTNPNPPDTGSGTSPIVTPPAGSATALWSIYNPTQAQIDSFGAWLWSNDFVEQLKKIFNDPMESIISLHKVFGTPTTGGTQNIAVGYLNSGVSSKVVTAQYTEVDCGEVQLLEYFGNVYDYKDTSIELYLPFIGIVPLSVADVMRSTIHIAYHIDVLTGACLADVEITRDAGAGGVLYQYSGDCAVHYPVSAGSYMGIVTGILSIAGGIAGTIATGGAAAPALIGAGAAATRMHADVSRSGGFSGNAGAMGSKVPYLIISRPLTALPDNYLDIEGIGSNKTVALSTCNGYTRIKEIYLQGIGDATEGELNELETLLKDGVIFPITETPSNE